MTTTGRSKLAVRCRQAGMPGKPRCGNGRVNDTTQDACMGILRIRLANALYDPWKADLICGPKISEEIILTGVQRNEEFDSESHRCALFRAITAFVSIIYTSARFTRERRGILN